MRLIIDRFEGNVAVCEEENREMLNVGKEQLPAGAKEGDVLEMAADGTITINVEETRKRKEAIKEKTKGLWK
jgi:hypothetical protein